MLKILFKRYITLLMLLAFTGQIMAASAMTCELEEAFQPVSHSNHETHMNHSMHDMDHAHGTLDKQPHKAQHRSFCCETMAHCLLGCALIGFNATFLFHLEILNAGIEDFYTSTATNPFIPSLYRPPIFI